MSKKTKKAKKPQQAKAAEAKPKRIAYSLELATTICEHIADGLALKEACLAPGMPARRTAYKWLALHDEFGRMYARAREERADLVADEVVTIADTEPDAQRARVRIDARKWWAAKVNPKRYGDRTTTTLEGGDKPLEIVSTTTDELLAEIDRLAARAAANGADQKPH